MMEPIKIRLNALEVWGIFHLLKGAFEKVKDRNVQLEVIVLVEFYPVWLKRVMDVHTTKQASKEKLYSIPVSVARVLHYRLQHEPYQAVNQAVLSKIDKALTDRSLKPDFPERIFN